MRKEINSRTVHSDQIEINEIKPGDTLILSVSPKPDEKKKVHVSGWQIVMDVQPLAAAALLHTEYPESIINDRGESLTGRVPAASVSTWQVGYGIAIKNDMHQERPSFQVLCRVGEERFVLLEPDQNNV